MASMIDSADEVDARRQHVPDAAPVVPSVQGRERLRCQGKAALLWGLALFVLAQAGLRFFIDTVRPELRDPTFEVKFRQFKDRLAACSAQPLSIVFFGSSMSVHGIKPSVLEPLLARELQRDIVAHNLAIHASGPLSHLIYLNRMLQRGVRPDLVVIEVSPLLHDTLKNTSDLALFPVSRLERLDLPLVEQYGHDYNLKWQWLESRLTPIHSHRLAMLNYWAKAIVPFVDQMMVWHDVDDHGWLKQEDHGPERLPAVLDHLEAEMKPRLDRYLVGAPPLRALTELLARLHQERIGAVLLQMPEGPRLRSLYPAAPIAALFQEFANLSRRYAAPLIHAREWLDESLFVDSHHLTWRGADALTGKLALELAPFLGQAGTSVAQGR